MNGMNGMNRKAVNREKGNFGALKKLVLFAKKYWGVILFAIVCAIGGAVCSVVGPNIIQDFIEIITNGMQAGFLTGVAAVDLDEVLRIGLFLVGIYGTSAILNFLQHFIMATVTQRTSYNLRYAIGHKINKIPLNYYDTHAFGDTLSRVTNDVDTIGQTVNSAIASLISSVVLLVGSVIMMFYTQWILALVVIGVSLLGFAAILFIMTVSQKYFRRRQDSVAEVNGHVEEFFTGHSVVHAYNAEGETREEFEAFNEKLRKSTYMAEFLSGLMQPLMGFIGNLSYVMVFLVGGALAFNGTISFAVIIAFTLYARLFSQPLSQIAQGFTSLQSASAACDRVFAFLEEEELSDESEKTAYVDPKAVQGDVVFDHVKFGYTPEKVIVRDFSANIKAGQKVAIVGPTGAGKTTLVNLLMRFYELDGGSISIDGTPSSDLTRENVHDIFGMVLQDTWLFEGTIRDNILYGKEVSDENLERICKAVGISHYIHTLPQGYDTVLTDAVSLSAGQKQLLTIARAMAENAPVLILDEATSSVDTRTEIQIQRAMDALTEGRTSFIIAHRLSTIKNADLIFYLEQGNIEETGTHEELLAKGGKYAALYNSQFETA